MGREEVSGRRVDRCGLGGYYGVGTLGFLCKHNGKALGGHSNRGRESGVGGGLGGERMRGPLHQLLPVFS